MIDTVEGVSAALTPIDDADEASLIVALRGYRIECETGATTARAARASGASFELDVVRGGSCSAREDAVLRVDSNGEITVVSSETTPLPPNGPVCGRRPVELTPDAAERALGAESSVGALLARMAYLEAASIPAFATLARDLARHGAPRDLLERVELARRDEIRHARDMRAAAKREGGAPIAPKVDPAQPKTAPRSRPRERSRRVRA